MSKSNPPLEPPAFNLPPDFCSDRGRYRLWSIRVPVNFDPSALDGTKIKFDVEEKKLLRKGGGTGCNVGGSGRAIAAFETPDGRKHGLALGHPSESDGFRILIRDDRAKDGSGGDDVDAIAAAGFSMRPLPVPFDAHLTVSDAAAHDVRLDTELAPSAERAPEPTGGTKLRVAYSHVPQRTGLRRRWTMPGSRGARTWTGTGTRMGRATAAAGNASEVKREGAPAADAANEGRAEVEVKMEGTMPPPKRRRGDSEVAEKVATTEKKVKVKKEKSAKRKSKKEKRKSSD